MRRLSGFDAWLLYSEAETIHQHTLKIAVLDPLEDHPFDLQHLRRRFERRLHLLEPLRFVLTEVPLALHHPMWRENCEVDLDHHLREVELPAPGGRPELDDVISEIVSVPLDRSRPLWELYVVTGLADGRVALVTKMHHSLADGGATVNLLERAVGPYSDQDLADYEPVPPDAVPGRAAVLAAAAIDHAQQLKALPGLVRRTILGIRRLRTQGPKPPPDAANVLRPPRIFLNGALSAQRRFTTVTLPLAEVKSARAALGVTLNDVILGLAAGMMRQLLLEVEGLAPSPLVASVPVGIDPDPERIAGNQLSGMLVSLPSHVADPIQRCRAASASAQVAKQQHRLLGQRLISEWLGYLPPWPFQRCARFAAHRRRADRTRPRLNVVVSNVTGPRSPILIAGYPVSEIWSVGPLYEGCGLNVTVWSYHEHLHVNLLADPALVPDIAAAAEGFAAAFEELRDCLAAPCRSGLDDEERP